MFREHGASVLLLLRGKQVGGDHVDTLTLITGQLDPHSYQLVKGDDEKLAMADIIVYNGLGLEHGPSLLYHLHAYPTAIAVGDAIQASDPELIIYVDGQIDPHIWMDISLWSRIVPVVVEKLVQVDSVHEADYRNQGRQVMEKMHHVHREVRDRLQQVPKDKRFIVTSHDAFNYFTRAYLADKIENVQGTWRKRFAAPEGLAPDSQLSVADLQAIINHMEKYKVSVLFPESNVSRDSIRKIVDAGIKKGMDLRVACCVLYGDAMGAKGSDGDTYVKMIQYNADMIAKELMQ